ncbi:hypothetical protein [Streptomyces sp. NPDC014006]|uniref:hypothetical protein n=1 Tax=Streptomyces sp. NPDC014006 TaxID=3364870 RepID=UPI0036F66BE0
MMSVRTAGVWAGLALLLLGVSACDSGSGQKSEAVDTNCDGSLNGSAVNAAKQLIGRRTLITSAEDGAAGAAKTLVSEYRTHGTDEVVRAGFCWLYGGEKDLSDITISFAVSDRVPRPNEVASMFTPYRLGALALTSPQRAVIYLKCSSVKFASDGSRQTIVLRGETNNRYTPHDTAAASSNNLVVMHSASLALSKALGCESNAGLPNQYSMPPKA